MLGGKIAIAEGRCGFPSAIIKEEKRKLSLSVRRALVTSGLADLSQKYPADS